MQQIAPLDEAATSCKQIVEESIRGNIGDSLLLSGGLDTSIIAHVAVTYTKPKCYTVVFPLAPAPDVFYAKFVARKLKLRWELVKLRPEQLQERLTDVIRVLKTFDPMEVRNSVAVHHGLVSARSQGFSKVMTGDAADELFAGYSFSFNLKPGEMIRRLRELWKIMHFSAQPMASALGIAASLPYLDPSVVEFAKTLAPEHLVGMRNGKKYGKLILRMAFEEVIGRRNAWRIKTPIEYGSGTTSLPKYYSAKVSDNEFNENKKEFASREGVKIRDKEHLIYYKLYRKMFLPPGESAITLQRCPDCGIDVRPRTTFCTTCGAYPISTPDRGIE